MSLSQKFRLNALQMIDYRSSFGMVLGGNSVRLQHCFLDYLKNVKSLLTSLVDDYTDTVEVYDNDTSSGIRITGRAFFLEGGGEGAGGMSSEQPLYENMRALPMGTRYA